MMRYEIYWMIKCVIICIKNQFRCPQYLCSNFFKVFISIGRLTCLNKNQHSMYFLNAVTSRKSQIFSDVIATNLLLGCGTLGTAFFSAKSLVLLPNVTSGFRKHYYY